MRNILITYLSDLPRFATGETVKDKVVSYKTELGKKVEAPYTNEVGLRYMCEYLKGDGRQPDIVIAVCSGVVKTEISEEFGGVTALGYFKTLLDDLCPKCSLKVVDTKGRMAGGNDIGNVFEAVTDIMPEDRLFLDITGGFRDSVYTLSLVGRFLEYKGAHIEKVIYSLRSGKTEGRVTDHSESNRIIDLISGINEFVTSGSARTIYAYLTNGGNEGLVPLASAMKMFSDRLSLSKTGDLDKVLSELDSAITALEKSEDSSLDALVIRDMIPVIKSKLFAGSGKPDYVAMVQWCVDNGLIQQALTLYREKIPRYIFESGIINASEEKIKDVALAKGYEDVYARMLFGDLMNGSGDVRRLRDVIKNRINGSSQVMRESYIRSMRKDPLYEGLVNYNTIYSFLTDGRHDLTSERRHGTFYDTDKNVKAAWDILLKDEVTRGINNIMRNDFYSVLLGMDPSGNTSGVEFLKRIKTSGRLPEGYSTKLKHGDLYYILASCVYIRQMRNEVNHANEESNMSAEDRELFKSMGFGCEVETDSLTHDLSECISRIIKAKEMLK